MGSKVQLSWGQQQECLLPGLDTVSPALGTAPGPGFPILAIPKCIFFSPSSSLEMFLAFPPIRS